MSNSKKENEKKFGVVTMKDLEDAINSADEMMNALRGNPNKLAKELLEELEIDKITLEALKELEGNDDIKRETIGAVQERRKRFDSHFGKFTSTLEKQVKKLEDRIADLREGLLKVADKKARKLLDDLDKFSNRVKKMKEKKLDALLIKSLESEFNIPRSKVESFLKKNHEAVKESSTGPKTDQEKYDAKVTVIQYYIKSIENTYKSRKLGLDDNKMAILNKMKENFEKLKKEYKRGESLEKFEALEKALALIIEDVRTPGILKQVAKDSGEISSQTFDKKETPAELSDLTNQAKSAFNSLTTISNSKHLVIDKDATFLHAKIREIRHCIESNLKQSSEKNTSARQEALGDLNTALNELKELEIRVLNAKKAVLLFKRLAQNKVLKQLEKMVNTEKGVFDNAISNRKAPISPPVPNRRK